MKNEYYVHASAKKMSRRFFRALLQPKAAPVPIAFWH
jgi:hypothetical protein